MKAQELRIGNYIHIIGENGDAKSLLSGRVVYVHEDEVRVHIRIENMINEQTGQLCDVEMVCVPPQSAIEPIPLTEELLLKCGFDNVEEDRYYHKDADLSIEVCDRGIELMARSGKLDTYFIGDTSEDHGLGEFIACGRPFSTLHELQNVIHALTGEELVAKF